MKTKKLIPPDLNQCQTCVPNGYSFMTLGGSPGLVRCTNKPTHVLFEKKPAKDGRKGSMSVCGRCLVAFRKITGRDIRNYRIEAITKGKP